METGTGPRELFWYLGLVPETNQDCELLCVYFVFFLKYQEAVYQNDFTKMYIYKLEVPICGVTIIN